jgi:hypothetical protein
MLGVTILAALAPLALAAPQPVNYLAKRGVNTGFPYGQEKIRGVNLGGVSRCLYSRWRMLIISGLSLNHGSVSHLL